MCADWELFFVPNTVSLYKESKKDGRNRGKGLLNLTHHHFLEAWNLKIFITFSLYYPMHWVSGNGAVAMEKQLFFFFLPMTHLYLKFVPLNLTHLFISFPASFPSGNHLFVLCIYGSVSVILVHCFVIPHISEMIQYMSFFVWFISLSIIFSRSICAKNGKISSFFMDE